MVFITAGFLIDAVLELEKSKTKRVEWSGQDHGAVFQLSLREGYLSISDKNFEIKINYKSFKQALYEGLHDDATRCKAMNPTITSESGLLTC